MSDAIPNLEAPEGSSLVGLVYSTSHLAEEYPQLITALLGQIPKEAVTANRRYELVDFTLEMWDPQYCILGNNFFDVDKLHALIYQLLSGEFDETLNSRLFPGQGWTLDSSYAERAKIQLVTAARELDRYPASGYATVLLGRDNDLWRNSDTDPTRRRPGDAPRTTIWQFHRRGNELSLLVHMQSLDLIREAPYEVPQSVAVLLMMCKALGADVEPGFVRIRIGSAYIRQRDTNAALWGFGAETGKLDLPWLRDSIDRSAVRAESKMRQLRREMEGSK